MTHPAVASNPSPPTPSDIQSAPPTPASHPSAPNRPPAGVWLHPSHHDKTGFLPAFQSMISIIVIAIFIITFCVQPFRIPSASMESTLLVGDFLLFDKQATALDGAGGLLPAAAIRRGDIVVFHDPVDASLHLVKRVIGLPGDRLRLRGGRVYINGNPISEPYAVYRPSRPDNFRDNFPRLQSADPDINSAWWIRMRNLIDNGELIIPTGNYFVLGDNRNDSDDSRYWGFVPRSAIVGKPLLIYFSLRQSGLDESAWARSAIAANPQRQPSSTVDAVADFARSGRTFQVVK
jgi:signal peptidase I